MIQFTVKMRDGTRWRAKANNVKAAFNEIAHARVTGSVGSMTMNDSTRCGGKVELIAEVHKIDVDGNDIQPS